MYFEDLYKCIQIAFEGRAKAMNSFTFLKVYILEDLLIFESLILEIFRKCDLQAS